MKSALFGKVFLHELRVLIADRTLLLVGSLLVALVLYGFYNGYQETLQREHAAQELAKKQADKHAENITTLRALLGGEQKPDPFANPFDPASVGGGMEMRYATLPTLALSPLAFGQSDMLPNYYKVTDRSKASFMYDTEIENPWNLLSGHFDITFVLVYLFPLIIFALSYNLLTVEREQGTLRMLLSQPLSLAILVAGKLLVRALPVLLIMAVLPLLLLGVLRPQLFQADQLPAVLGWLGLVLAYGGFWFALALLVNIIGRSSATNALALMAAWVLFVLVIPVVLNIVVGLLSPAPSRIELATKTRLITIEGLNRYHDKLSSDYRFTQDPEVLLPRDGKIEVAPRRQAQFLIQRDVDKEIQRVLNEFSTQLAVQQMLVERFGWISPAIVTYEGMAAIAGNGAARYLEFQQQVDRFHERWKEYFEPRLLNSIAMTEQDYAEMPHFEWAEVPVQVSGILKRLLLLVIPALIVIAFAIRRMRRFSVV
ncbi:ABC-2 type transport system permease protein [Methylobacillus rhizosphaerae]|uniref:ABC-2 type transport system permease protein n=1 Tax=Methylobacillus rhizosphaerae TaxID=551994 RepID=A0A238ZLL2_9PROT|nr:DUF3526 domain-containing protein [Methylobacillus rhizosphaerae]SNR84200.1 ABC-2 type transport system permease protein [Methylobacillus rhizosphaerae]